MILILDNFIVEHELDILLWLHLHVSETKRVVWGTMHG